MNKMIKSKPVFVKSKITGGHFALQTRKAKKPFENNMSECKSIKLYPSDIVADIGAYIGEYSLYAINQKVKKVYSYEPTPYTFQILEMNKKSGMDIFQMAVIHDDREYVELYLSSGIGVTNSTEKKLRKAGQINVKAIKYEDAIRDANVVKIDVEGAEYSYNIIQPQLRAIILEFHPLVNKPWRDMAENIMQKLERAGFKPIMRPSFKSGWSLTGSWVR